ncbi:Ribosomal lysine N-methyltransferase 4 [Vermiconidia calcicola]|uniref:Ribosomal lysine N-methyltransferase 4 n=1 Tax=Vermiconidia calcicola TaxID=1690605 RepID=A0ACC3NI96_9PEZI|nr:Ribosomal lysine N-methyltransferase 4 [Vermiconidia calcicola]
MRVVLGGDVVKKTRANVSGGYMHVYNGRLKRGDKAQAANLSARSNHTCALSNTTDWTPNSSFFNMLDDSGNDEFYSRSMRFIDWLKCSGTAVSTKIELADLRQQSAGRGVVAKEDIEDDEELFSVPRSSILTVETSGLPEAIRSDLQDPWLSLILAMAFEQQRGKESPWKPYFDVLPATFDTLMYWSTEELEYLRGSAVADKIGKQSADKAFSEQLVPILRQHEAALDLAQLSDDDLLTLFHKMGSTIMAYAFDLESPSSQSKTEGEDWEEDSDAGESLPKGMVPFADMLNADADRNNAKLFYEDDKVVMKTITAVQKGEELFNDYGPLPRADVLRRYGYVTDNYATYDVFEVALATVKDVTKEHLKMAEAGVHTRLDYFDEQGILEDGYDVSRASSEDGPFTDEFVVLLNTLVLPAADFDKLKKKDKLPKPELSEKALQLLYHILLHRRAMYPIDDRDSTRNPSGNLAAASGTSNEHRRNMAVQIIRGEKEVLQEAADTVQKLLGDGNKRKVDTFEDEVANMHLEKKQKTW